MPIGLLVQPRHSLLLEAVSCLSEEREYKLASVEQISPSLKSRATARFAEGVKQEV